MNFTHLIRNLTCAAALCACVTLVPAAPPSDGIRVPSASTQSLITPPILPLFNGKDLTGWKAYGRNDSPDAAKSWAVAEGGVITCTGQPNGYLRTTRIYANYRLTFEWRWPTTPPPTLDAKGRPRSRNSGMLVFMQEPDAVWCRCVECQIQEKNVGDFWLQGGAECAEVLAARAKALADAGNDEAAKKKALSIHNMVKKSNVEKPVGEWNTCEIVCRGDTVIYTVNGVEQNRATGLNIKSGYIGLQAEGAPVEFRNIMFQPLE